MRYAERGGRVEAYSLGTALILEMFSISNSYSGRYHFPDRFPLGLTGNEEITKNVTRLRVPLSEFVIVKPGIAPRCGKGERMVTIFRDQKSRNQSPSGRRNASPHLLWVQLTF
jgi:hypothetical protein